VNNSFIKALRKEPVPATPIWVMRQAGRYLPEYRALRGKHTFLEMVYTPEIAAEVTLQPLKRMDFDAAIIFSDILVIPQAMGMKLDFHEGRGPVFDQPVRDFAQLKNLTNIEETDMLDPVLSAISLVKNELAGKVPLIGFAGAPWTLAAYMIEGSGSKNFRWAKAALYEHPEAMHALLDKLTANVTRFLLNQIQAGAQAVQLFDSWAGQLSPDQFNEFSLPYLKAIAQAVKATGTPLILFARGAAHSLDQLADTGAAALGIDWQTDMAEAVKVNKNRCALQGNLDPIALYAPRETLKAEIRKVLNKAQGLDGHVFNLGHGILPDTPIESVQVLVDCVHEFSTRGEIELPVVEAGSPS